MKKLNIQTKFTKRNKATIFLGDCRNFLETIPDKSVQLIITSPPYNLGKEYEKPLPLSEYIDLQREVINLCIDKLKPEGNICWQVGNFIDKSSSKSQVIPLDTILYDVFANRALKLRNRIIWTFGHGLHSRNRFSGRYETINWFSRTDDYIFNLDAVRVPQKYPGKKSYKGPNKGEYSSNPLGKNPSDIWDIPNVKSRHAEKTIHPCQFPMVLVDRLINGLSNKGDIVFDPFLGVGTTTASGIRLKRKVAGAELVKSYYKVAVERTQAAHLGALPYREDKPVYQPPANTQLTKNPFLDDSKR